MLRSVFTAPFRVSEQRPSLVYQAAGLLVRNEETVYVCVSVFQAHRRKICTR